MSKIVIESLEIVNKIDLGQGNFVLDLAEFSKTDFIKPGQFIHIKIPTTDIYFRRAFSIYDVIPGKNIVRILFKIFGRGTTFLAKLKAGERLDIMGPLGQGFEYPPKKDIAVLIAGGIGLPPIYFLARKLVENDYNKNRILFFYGGAAKDDLVEIDKVEELGIRVIPATDDGSYGFKGLITEAIGDYVDLSNGRLNFLACGPQAMLGAVDKLARQNDLTGQLSLEAPMPCGVGICLGCILPLRAGGYTRVCREGPVYKIGEVVI